MTKIKRRTTTRKSRIASRERVAQRSLNSLTCKSRHTLHEFLGICSNGGIATVFRGRRWSLSPHIDRVSLLHTDWIYTALKKAFLGAQGVAGGDSNYLQFGQNDRI